MHPNAARVVDLLAVLLLVAAFFVPIASRPARAVTCSTIYGTDGNDTKYGSDACQDTMWLYAGNDEGWGFDLGDSLHMGAGTDTAHGGNWGDFLYGGDNPTTSQEILKGGDGGDEIQDQTGPDWDFGCGGPGTEHFRFDDGDGRDKAVGETHQYGHIDLFTMDSGDEAIQDGSC